MGFKYEDDVFNLEFDKITGAMKSLLHKKIDLELISEPRLAANFKLLVPLPDRRNNYIIGAEQKLTNFEKGEKFCTLTWDDLQNVNGRFKISVKQRFGFKPDDSEIEVTTTIENKSEYVIEEVWSPIVGGFNSVREREKTRFICSGWDGSGQFENMFTKFPAEGNYWREYYDFFEVAYPWHLTMQWVDFYNKETSEGIYFASHDKSAQVTFFHFELRPGVVQAYTRELSRWPRPEDVEPNTPIGLSCSIAKLPFIKPGETWVSSPACIHFHKGDWHSGADRYRRWINTWMKFAEKPRWVSEGISWQTTNMNWPDDLISLGFSDIPKMAKDAIECGVNVLQIYGFHRGGLDRGYPDYYPDPRLGTPEDLIKAVKKANELGVKAILFVNDQVADINLEWFEKELHKYAAKDRFGKPKHVGWGFHTFSEKNFWGFRQLAIMCPYVKEYQDIIVEQFERLAKWGANGFQIDKLGIGGLCYDETHCHRPAEAFSQGVVETLRRIHEACRRHNPEFSIAAETCWDICWQFINVSYMRLWDWNHTPVFKYTFPEALITVCLDQFDYHSVNNCIRVGYVINAEIYNYHDTLGKTRKLGQYIKEVLRIRNELIDYLWNGQFRDTLGATIEGETEGLLYGVHVNRKNGKKAVVIMNTSEISKTVKVTFQSGDARQCRVYKPFSEVLTKPLPCEVVVTPSRIAIIVESED